MSDKISFDPKQVRSYDFPETVINAREQYTHIIISVPLSAIHSNLTSLMLLISQLKDSLQNVGGKALLTLEILSAKKETPLLLSPFDSESDINILREIIEKHLYLETEEGEKTLNGKTTDGIASFSWNDASEYIEKGSGEHNISHNVVFLLAPAGTVMPKAEEVADLVVLEFDDLQESYPLTTHTGSVSEKTKELLKSFHELSACEINKKYADIFARFNKAYKPTFSKFFGALAENSYSDDRFLLSNAARTVKDGVDDPLLCSAEEAWKTSKETLPRGFIPAFDTWETIEKGPEFDHYIRKALDLYFFWNAKDTALSETSFSGRMSGLYGLLKEAAVKGDEKADDYLLYFITNALLSSSQQRFKWNGDKHSKSYHGPILERSMPDFLRGLSLSFSDLFAAAALVNPGHEPGHIHMKPINEDKAFMETASGIYSPIIDDFRKKDRAKRSAEIDSVIGSVSEYMSKSIEDTTEHNLSFANYRTIIMSLELLFNELKDDPVLTKKLKKGIVSTIISCRSIKSDPTVEIIIKYLDKKGLLDESDAYAMLDWFFELYNYDIMNTGTASTTIKDMFDLLWPKIGAKMRGFLQPKLLKNSSSNLYELRRQASRSFNEDISILYVGLKDGDIGKEYDESLMNTYSEGMTPENMGTLLGTLFESSMNQTENKKDPEFFQRMIDTIYRKCSLNDFIIISSHVIRGSKNGWMLIPLLLEKAKLHPQRMDMLKTVSGAFEEVTGFDTYFEIDPEKLHTLRTLKSITEDDIGGFAYNFHFARAWNGRVPAGLISLRTLSYYMSKDLKEKIIGHVFDAIKIVTEDPVIRPVVFHESFDSKGLDRLIRSMLSGIGERSSFYEAFDISLHESMWIETYRMFPNVRPLKSTMLFLSEFFSKLSPETRLSIISEMIERIPKVNETGMADYMEMAGYFFQQIEDVNEFRATIPLFERIYEQLEKGAITPEHPIVLAFYKKWDKMFDKMDIITQNEAFLHFISDLISISKNHPAILGRFLETVTKDGSRSFSLGMNIAHFKKMAMVRLLFNSKTIKAEAIEKIVSGFTHAISTEGTSLSTADIMTFINHALYAIYNDRNGDFEDYAIRYMSNNEISDEMAFLALNPIKNEFYKVLSSTPSKEKALKKLENSGLIYFLATALKAEDMPETRKARLKDIASQVIEHFEGKEDDIEIRLLIESIK